MIVAVGELDALDLAVADDRLGVGLGDDLDAARLDRLLQQVAGGRIELALHQRRHDVQHGDVHAAFLEAGGGLEAEQAAADDDGLGARLRREQHGVDVVEVAVGEHARQILAGHRNDERHRAGGDDQLVVGLRHAVVGGDGLGLAVDGDDLVALVERDAVLDVPAVAVDDDFLERLLARQNRRQHDAVVVHARFGVEDGDLVAVGRGFQQVLQHPPGAMPLPMMTSFSVMSGSSPAHSARLRRCACSAMARCCSILQDGDMHPGEAGGDDRRTAA